MQDAERRAHPRVKFPVLVLFRLDPAAPFEPAYGADLSEGGLAIRGASAEVGTHVDLQLVEPRGQRPLELLGRVVRADADGFAVSFADLDPLQRQWLRAAIRRRESDEERPETEDLLGSPFDEL